MRKGIFRFQGNACRVWEEWAIVYHLFPPETTVGDLAKRLS